MNEGVPVSAIKLKRDLSSIYGEGDTVAEMIDYAQGITFLFIAFRLRPSASKHLARQSLSRLFRRDDGAHGLFVRERQTLPFG